jgi:hypothetical protein
MLQIIIFKKKIPPKIMAYKTVFLLSCSQKKANSTTQAEHLYQGAYFKKALKYARHQDGDILILSAQHHVLSLSDMVAPYNLTLKNLCVKDRKEWAKIVQKQLTDKGYDLQDDHFVFLTGKDYYIHLIPYISHFQIIGEGLSIGKKLHHLDIVNSKYQL